MNRERKVEVSNKENKMPIKFKKMESNVKNDVKKQPLTLGGNSRDSPAQKQPPFPRVKKVNAIQPKISEKNSAGNLFNRRPQKVQGAATTPHANNDKNENSISNVVPRHNLSISTTDANSKHNINNKHAGIATVDTSHLNPNHSIEHNSMKLINDENLITNVSNECGDEQKVPTTTTTTPAITMTKSDINYAHVINDCDGQINTNNCQIISQSMNSLHTVDNKQSEGITGPAGEEGEEKEINDVQMNKQVNRLSLNEVKGDAYDDDEDVDGREGMGDGVGVCAKVVTTVNDIDTAAAVEEIKSELDDDTLSEIEVLLDNKSIFRNYVTKFMETFMQKFVSNVVVAGSSESNDNAVNDVAQLEKADEMHHVSNEQLLQVFPLTAGQVADENIMAGSIDAPQQIGQSTSISEASEANEESDENKIMQSDDNFAVQINEIGSIEQIAQDSEVPDDHCHELSSLTEVSDLNKTDEYENIREFMKNCDEIEAIQTVNDDEAPQATTSEEPDSMELLKLLDQTIREENVDQAEQQFDQIESFCEMNNVSFQINLPKEITLTT